MRDSSHTPSPAHAPPERKVACSNHAERVILVGTASIYRGRDQERPQRGASSGAPHRVMGVEQPITSDVARRVRLIVAGSTEVSSLDGSAVLLADNMEVLPTLPSGTFQLIYIDPPFNTGTVQARKTLATVADDTGDRIGFGGRRYRTRLLAESSYHDAFEDYLTFLEPRLREARRILKTTGTFYFHIDYREAHYCKLLLDEIFGRESFLNEIIWAYDYGARTKRRWPAKHDTILVYVNDPDGYYFDSESVDREPYMAPGLVTAEKAARGKLPTDVWWHTIVPTNGREKTGYPTQKPEGIIRRMVQASTRPGDLCLDFFAGSGTLGAVAAALGRRYMLIDNNPDAIAVIRSRLSVMGDDLPQDVIARSDSVGLATVASLF